MKNKELKKFYNKVYGNDEKKHYTKLINANNSLPEEEKEVLKEIKWKGKNVLDVGCGTGRICFEIAKKGAKKVTGIDFSDSAIETAKKMYFRKSLHYICEDINKHKEQYDIIISLGTIEHMDNPILVLKKMKKLLAKNGKLVITCPNWTNPRGYILQTLRILFNAPITLADLHYFTPAQFKEIAKKLNMNLKWSTFDYGWALEDRLIKDFKRRLPNVFRDMGVKNNKKEISTFIKWLEKNILPIEKRSKWNGATAMYVMTNKK